MHQARRHAFTTLELLIAIAVILILAGILLVGGRSILRSGGEKATKVTLMALNGMLTEMDSKKQLSKAPSVWLWYDSGSGTPPQCFPNPANGVDFWHIPFFDGANLLRKPDAMDAPALVTEDTGVVARHASRAIINTQMVMQKMLAMPANRQAMQNMSEELRFVPTYQSGEVRAPGNDGVMHTDDDENSQKEPSVTEPVYYLAGTHVIKDKKPALCTVAGTSDAATFIDDTTQAAPILLDAWHNPIIFVPATGLRVRKLQQEKELDPTNKEQTVIDISPEGRTLIDTASGLPYVTQIGRPFFASAGPDGDFATGDDNIYSFQP